MGEILQTRSHRTACSKGQLYCNISDASQLALGGVFRDLSLLIHFDNGLGLAAHEVYCSTLSRWKTISQNIKKRVGFTELQPPDRDQRSDLIGGGVSRWQYFSTEDLSIASFRGAFLPKSIHHYHNTVHT